VTVTGTPTANWGFPTYDGTEPGSLKTIANAQANAAESAMNSASKGFFIQSATKAALPTTGLRVGQHATVYADGTPVNNGDYGWNGTAWVRSYGVIGAFTANGIYSAGSPVPQAVSMNGRVFLEGIVTSSSATFGTGTVYAVGSIPAAFAPTSNRTFPVFAGVGTGSALGYIVVASTGAISLVFITNPGTGTLLLSLDSVSWRQQ
jgi:hypothetical protein